MMLTMSDRVRKPDCTNPWETYSFLNGEGGGSCKEGKDGGGEETGCYIK